MIRELYPNGRCLDVDYRSMTEEAVIDILTNQVDADLKLWTYGRLVIHNRRTGMDVPGAYLVPASPFWLARVEGER